jgi:hypothetical protein
MLNEGERQHSQHTHTFFTARVSTALRKRRAIVVRLWNARLKAFPNQPIRFRRLHAPLHLGPYHAWIAQLPEQHMHAHPTHRSSTHTIPEILPEEGHEARARRSVWERKRKSNAPEVLLFCAFEFGQNAQVDWGEAAAILAGRLQQGPFFLMRLRVLITPGVRDGVPNTNLRRLPARPPASLHTRWRTASSHLSGNLRAIRRWRLAPALAVLTSWKARRETCQQWKARPPSITSPCVVGMHLRVLASSGQ